MPYKKYVIDEDELKDLKEQVASIEAFLRNDQNIEEIRKRVIILNYLLDKIEQKLV